MRAPVTSQIIGYDQDRASMQDLAFLGQQPQLSEDMLPQSNYNQEDDDSGSYGGQGTGDISARKDNLVSPHADLASQHIKKGQEYQTTSFIQSSTTGGDGSQLQMNTANGFSSLV